MPNAHIDIFTGDYFDPGKIVNPKVRDQSAAGHPVVAVEIIPGICVYVSDPVDADQISDAFNRAAKMLDPVGSVRGYDEFEPMEAS